MVIFMVYKSHFTRVDWEVISIFTMVFNLSLLAFLSLASLIFFLSPKGHQGHWKAQIRINFLVRCVGHGAVVNFVVNDLRSSWLVG